MPLVRVSMRKGRSPAFKQAVADGLYTAMTETFEVPSDDRFIVMHEHGDQDFDCSATYGGMARTDDLVLVQITCSDTRSLQTKQRFYQRLTELLTEAPGLAPDDVFINLVEVRPENWSFGRGEAQYVR